MLVPEFTVVVGVDRKHLRQLSWVLPTWRKHKPSLFERPWVVFYDRLQLSYQTVAKVVGQREDLSIVPWPAVGIDYERKAEGRFGDPQRYRMLSGFVHVPAMVASTPYWLKLDTDVVAIGKDDWIDEKWFKTSPAIISHPWNFTKPANQVDLLDEWVACYRREMPLLSKQPPLNLHPQRGAERLGHRRIISWCGFFSTAITRFASNLAETFCGQGQLPVPSQDGYLWYVSRRLQLDIARVNMKSLGFEHWHTEKNIYNASIKAL